MKKNGWPKPDTWLRRPEETESAELTDEEERIFEEMGLDLSPLPEDAPDPWEESQREFLELVTSGSFQSQRLLSTWAGRRPQF